MSHRNAPGNFVTASAANMSKASTASNVFVAPTPAERNPYIKSHLKANHELAKDRGTGDQATAVAARNRATADSPKANLSGMIYDRLMSEHKRRQEFNRSIKMNQPRVASPIHRESRDDQSLRQELRAGTRLKRIQSANRTSGRPSAFTLLDRGTADGVSTQKLLEKWVPPANNTT